MLVEKSGSESPSWQSTTYQQISSCFFRVRRVANNTFNVFAPRESKRRFVCTTIGPKIAKASLVIAGGSAIVYSVSQLGHVVLPRHSRHAVDFLSGLLVVTGSILALGCLAGITHECGIRLERWRDEERADIEKSNR